MNRVRIGAVIAVVIAVAFIVWLIAKDGGGDGGDKSAERAEPAAASVRELRALPDALGHEVYWAGTRPGNTYELTQTRDGSVYIRYLPPGVDVGANEPRYTTVGTYPHADAFKTVQKAARRRGATVERIEGGGLAVRSREHPKSVYFAYPNSDFLLEVFDPSPTRALRLVTSGQVRAIR